MVSIHVLIIRTDRFVQQESGQEQVRIRKSDIGLTDARPSTMRDHQLINRRCTDVRRGIDVLAADQPNPMTDSCVSGDGNS